MTPREHAKAVAHYVNGTCGKEVIVYDGLCHDCLPTTAFVERQIRAAGAPLVEALDGLLDWHRGKPLPKEECTKRIVAAADALAAWRRDE